MKQVLSSPELRQKAVDMAEVNPQAAMVYAVLDLALAVSFISSDLSDIAKQHERLAVETGGVAIAINNLGDEIGQFGPLRVAAE